MAKSQTPVKTWSQGHYHKGQYSVRLSSQDLRSSKHLGMISRVPLWNKPDTHWECENNLNLSLNLNIIIIFYWETQQGWATGTGVAYVGPLPKVWEQLWSVNKVCVLLSSGIKILLKALKLFLTILPKLP